MKKFCGFFILLLLFSNVYGQSNEKEQKFLTLEIALKTGLDNNPVIKAAAEKINAARGRKISGVSLPQPEVSLSYEFIPSGKGLGNYGERTLEIKQSFDFPTRYFLKGAILSDEVEIETYRLNEVMLNACSQIKKAYFNLLTKKGELSLAGENLEIMDNFYMMAEARLKAGEGTELEKMTARVQLNEAKNNYTTCKNQLKTAFTELNKNIGYIGDVIDSSYIISDSLNYREINLTPEEICKKSETDNPKLKISELAVEISAKNKKLAWSGLLPEFSLSYLSQSSEGRTGYYGASIGVSVPLWFMFKQNGEIEEASAGKSIAENEHEAEKISVFASIKAAYNEYVNYKKQIELYVNELLPESSEIHRVALKSFEAGEISYIEYLPAKQALINSKGNYLKLLNSYNSAVTELEQASGCKLTN
jgi:outer membrane protein TolC